MRLAKTAGPRWSVPTERCALDDAEIVASRRPWVGKGCGAVNGRMTNQRTLKSFLSSSRILK